MVVTPIRRSDPDVGIDLLRRALESDHEALWSGVASFYYHPSWVDSVRDEDVRLIEKLLAHPNLSVRLKAIGALWNLGKVRPETAKGFALALELDGNDDLAEDYFMRLEMGIGVRLEGYDDHEIDILIRKLSNVNDLEDHFINTFLVFCSKRRPLSVLRMLFERIDTFDWDALRGARAIPALGFDLKLEGLPLDRSYPSMLREVRDRTLASERRNAHLIPRLFKEITLDFSTDFFPTLAEWLETNDKDKVEAVAYLLTESPPDFIFTHTAFVGQVLRIAYAIGDECSKVVSGHLRTSAIAEGRQGTAGQPFPQDIALKDRATATAKLYQMDSPQWRFYDSLANYAAHSIGNAMLYDGEPA
jgi:hypothetical protein